MLAVDPGKSTGFALFSSEDNFHWKKDRIGVRTDRFLFYETLDLFAPDVLVCEKFVLYPWKSMAQGWSNMETSKIEGACEAYAHRRDIQFILQSTDNRDIGYMHGQVPHLPKSNPSNHAHDAWAHGCYWVINTNKGVLV